MELNLIHIFSVLAIAWLAGRLAVYVGLPSILGELAAGIVFGPALLGWIAPNEATRILAELGVYLLMLYIGMEMDARALWRASYGGLLAAIGGFILPFAAGYGLMLYFGYPVTAALFMGTAMGVTSLATKSRILVDLDLIGTRIASVMMAGALFADTMALVMFAAILSLAATGASVGAGIEWSALGIAFAKAVAFFGVAILIGLRALPLLGRLVERVGFAGRTSSFTIVLLVALVFAEMAKLSGLHSVLGAFVAGLFLKQGIINKKWSGDVREVAHDISIGFLSPIFFVMAGFHVSLGAVADNLGLTLLVIAVATIAKVVGTALFYASLRRGWKEGLAIGAGMNGRGAVEVIMAELALGMGLISQDIFSVLVVMAFATTMTVPLLLKLAVASMRKDGALVMDAGERDGTLIVGAGPVAAAFAECFGNDGPVTIIDQNEAILRRVEVPGVRKILGNALNWDDLNRADADRVGRLIVLVPNLAIGTSIAGFARREFDIPEIFVPWSEQTAAAFETEFERLKLATLVADVDVLRAYSRESNESQPQLSRAAFVETDDQESSAMQVATPVRIPVVVETGGKRVPVTRNMNFRNDDLIWFMSLPRWAGQAV